MASHGTDQLMVQRMLAARNLRESRLALLSSGVVIFMQFTLFLLIGAGLYVYYGQHPGMVFRTNDYIFPSFIVQEMPLGIAGLLVAAILAAAMSNLSAALNSLSSTTVVDFYMGFRPKADDRERGIVSKSSTVLWALVLFVIAIYSLSVGGKGHVVEIGLSIASVAYGCLLGVFLLGTLTKFATEVGTAIGMVCGFALNVWLWQGAFPMQLGPVRIPHIAFTWYVIIGALVTFAIGSFASLIFRKQSRFTGIAAAVLLLVFAGDTTILPSAIAQSAAFDFTPMSTLINNALANHHLPGAVVVVGHNGKVVFRQAYGNRKLAGEPGLDGKPSPAEPMTEDTIFDMASLTKDLATATAVMQLYESGKIASFDDPVEKYLPAFNASNDSQRAKVTLRMLLTHTSGAAPDVSLKDPWGLSAPDRAEGIHRALTMPLKDAPGSVFTYSDINFILLGYLVEQLSGQTEDVYASEHIFKPLGMNDTRYLPVAKACGPHRLVGAAIVWAPPPPGRIGIVCLQNTWGTSLLERVAPTTHDDEGNVTTNPHFDMLTRGTVHDPTTRRMGGVAGHAGVFSTAYDVSLFASALLEKLLHNTGPFPLKQSTLQLMTTPEQPGHTPGQIAAANAAEQREIVAGDKPAAPGLAPAYPAIKGQNLRGYGWDIDTGFSKPRGVIFPIGSFGHTGFTGTSLWMDPASDTYVVLLANAIHPRGNPPISNLRGQVATAAARVLNLYASRDADSYLNADPTPVFHPTLTGIDVLEQTQFTAIAKLRDFGLMTNQSGLDAQGHRTIDILHALPSDGPKLTTVFSPEHGITGKLDTEKISAETDAATGLHVTSLYGSKESDRRPTHEQLKDLDAVVIDLQDAGVHFWTYEAAVGYFLEAAAREQTEFHHDLEIILLDRPNLIGGTQVQGPVSDPGSESYVNYMPLPVRHGLTLGELAKYIVGTKQLATHLIVIPMQNWKRTEYFADTGLPWTPPSPNLRTPEAAILYPALGLIETTNVSVGRGTASPFSFFGAPWFNAAKVAAALDARHIPGVSFQSTTELIAEDANRYPFHGQTIPAIQIAVTNRTNLNSPELGVEILSVLHDLYPDQFHLDRAMRLVAHQATLDGLRQSEDPRRIAEGWNADLSLFKARCSGYLLYQ
jgi:uncharacterized protein YbbC (DUF1343 family)/CubicO group peptidase (beta-lactamase class C family)